MGTPVDCFFATKQEWLKIVVAFSRTNKKSEFRRTSGRYACTGEIKVLGEINDEPFKQTWSLMQLSAEGLTARSHLAIPEETHVSIHWHQGEQDLVLLGQVRHCTQTVGGYKVGIKLEFPKNQPTRDTIRLSIAPIF